MNQGRVEPVGSPEEIYRRPQSEFVATFIGTAEFLDGRVVERRGPQTLVEISGQHLAVNAVRSWEPGARVRAMVRPEAVRLRSDGDGFQAVVRRVTFLGASVEFEVEAAGCALSASHPATTAGQVFAPGDRVTLTVDESSLHLLPAASGESADEAGALKVSSS